jgi:hypothetical protein
LNSDPENGCYIFMRNVGISLNYTVTTQKKPQIQHLGGGGGGTPIADFNYCPTVWALMLGDRPDLHIDRPFAVT